MKRIPSALLLSLLMSRAVFAAPPAAFYQVTASRVVETGTPREACRKISATVSGMNGWLINSNSREIDLRLPPDSVPRFLAMVDSLGMVVDPSYRRVDCRQEYLGLTAGIRAKEALLEQYLRVLDSADLGEIYPVSRSVAELQSGIELLKGQLQGMLGRIEFAEVRITFQFPGRHAPPPSGVSDFGWLNSVNLPSLLKRFE